MRVVDGPVRARTRAEAAGYGRFPSVTPEEARALEPPLFFLSGRRRPLRCPLAQHSGTAEIFMRSERYSK